MDFILNHAPRARATVLVLVALMLLACSKSGPPSRGPTSTATLSAPDIQAVVVSSDLAIGPNRFVLGLIDHTRGSTVHNAQLGLRLFNLTRQGSGYQETLTLEIQAKAITVEKGYTHVHADGTAESHGAGEIGVYVASLKFDSPGEWGVEISGTLADGRPLPVLTTPVFQVLEKSRSVPLGEPAPKSIQPILKDADDIFEISTDHPQDPHMHDMTIADAVTSGKPTVIVFATPGFCRSHICGPTKQMMDQLYERYKGRANFIHVEPYDLGKARNGEELVVLPWIHREWGLKSEPWAFFVNSEGIISAKFEGVVSLDELEAHLQRLVTTEAAP